MSSQTAALIVITTKFISYHWVFFAFCLSTQSYPDSCLSPALFRSGMISQAGQMLSWASPNTPQEGPSEELQDVPEGTHFHSPMKSQKHAGLLQL